MPIEYKRLPGEFILWRDATHAPALGIESAQLSSCVAEVKRLGLKGVFGTAPYFQEPSLDFLMELPWVEAVAIWDVPLRDVTAIYGLKELRYLRLPAKRPPLDLTKLPSVEKLVWDWQMKDRGAGALDRLQELFLWRFKSSDGSLRTLDLPKSLRSLSVVWSSAKTLDGLSELPALKTLEIERCRDLESLADLPAACPGLETLLITASGKLDEREAMRVASQLPQLRRLVAQNKSLIG